jgi:hypothetical protein
MTHPLQGKRFKDEEIIVTQAERIIERFGGVRNLIDALENIGIKRDLTNIYRWTYSKEKGGTGGLVPTTALIDVIAAARKEGVFLTQEDLDPRSSVKINRVFLDEVRE